MQEELRSLKTSNRKLSKQQSAVSLISSMQPPAMRVSRDSLIGASHDRRSSQKARLEQSTSSGPPEGSLILQVSI